MYTFNLNECKQHMQKKKKKKKKVDTLSSLTSMTSVKTMCQLFFFFFFFFAYGKYFIMDTFSNITNQTLPHFPTATGVKCGVHYVEIATENMCLLS